MGKIKFVGFTGHKDPSVHLRMLEMAGKHNFTFDAVQMPLNVMDAHFRSFGAEVLPILVRKQIAVLGMKPMGAGLILQSKTVTALECLQYALSLPTSVVITGIESRGKSGASLHGGEDVQRVDEGGDCGDLGEDGDGGGECGRVK